MTDTLDILAAIDPSILSYQEWVNVGMALKADGRTWQDWDAWSRRDSARYHQGECERKWRGFLGSTLPVTQGTIVHLAQQQGWHPTYQDDDPGYELAWDAVIGGHKDDLVVVDRGYLQEEEVTEPAEWTPAAQIITYLETLFEAAELVGFVTEAWYDEAKEKYLPTKGVWDRTAGQLIEALAKSHGDLGAVFGDPKPEAGAWIRFNPLDGQGVRNENVTEYRYALVESDKMPIAEQNALLRKLELPIACLVHSGGKSLHAIVKVEAKDYAEYRTRVDYLYNVCARNGLQIDTQNKNPSRLSRMPGVMRNGRKQWLVDTHIGKKSWDEWKEWIESVNDDLPDPESMATIWDHLPPLSPSLIDGVLRQGHKMLLAGPSKAGKSYLLIELCIALAEGKSWLGWPCAKGRVLYVNLELDRASCFHRFRDVYQGMGIAPQHLHNIDIWNLRGRSIPMDQLAPKLIRRAAKQNYIAIVLDPIYKVITGDENSADQMAKFCNQFDRICTNLDTAVIYCHHHSKGAQGDKRSVDRASGSGVFARDPDALLDLTELEKTRAVKKLLEDKATCRACMAAIRRDAPGYADSVGLDDQESASAMTGHAKMALTPAQYDQLLADCETARAQADRRTAWRIEGTLREFPSFAPVDVWFDYPIHRMDDNGVLHDLSPEDNTPAWRKKLAQKRDPEVRKKEQQDALDMAFAALEGMGDVTIAGLAEYMGVSKMTISRRLRKNPGFELVKVSEIPNDPPIVRRVGFAAAETSDTQ